MQWLKGFQFAGTSIVETEHYRKRIRGFLNRAPETKMNHYSVRHIHQPVLQKQEKATIPFIRNKEKTNDFPLQLVEEFFLAFHGTESPGIKVLGVQDFVAALQALPDFWFRKIAYPLMHLKLNHSPPPHILRFLVLKTERLQKKDNLFEGKSDFLGSGFAFCSPPVFPVLSAFRNLFFDFFLCFPGARSEHTVHAFGFLGGLAILAQTAPQIHFFPANPTIRNNHFSSPLMEYTASFFYWLRIKKTNKLKKLEP
jgi:hypothetical protein